MLQNFEFAILDGLQSIHCEFLNAVMIFFTTLGEWGALWIATGIALLFPKKYRRTGVTILLGLVLGLILVNFGIKNIVARPRPFAIRPIELLVSIPSEFSFPSGHTVSSFGAATTVFLKNKKFGAVALAAATLIAFSRLYLYVHFPSDILAGIVIGVAISLISNFIMKKPKWQWLGS